MARQLLEGATDATKIAIVSAPSVFVQVKNMLAGGTYASPQVRLLEHDHRFEVFEDEFVHYNFETPMRLPGKYMVRGLYADVLTWSAEMKGAYHRVLCDPPFLSADCQTKGEPPINLELTLQCRLESRNSANRPSCSDSEVALRRQKFAQQYRISIEDHCVHW